METPQIELNARHCSQLVRRANVDRNSVSFETLPDVIEKSLGLSGADYYVLANGKRINNGTEFSSVQVLHVCPRILGGKGGFGSMLRAIGAQIEKTTNRDACRDLSGRRLRDINEEQRLKRWFAKSGEREQEKEEQRQKKLEKLRRLQDGPELPPLNDPEYFKQREEIEDAVYAAVDYCFDVAKPSTSTAAAAAGAETIPAKDSEEASNSSSTSSSESEPKLTSAVAEPSSSKRPAPEKKQVQPKKKLKKLMLDEDLESDSSDDSDEEAVAKN